MQLLGAEGGQSGARKPQPSGQAGHAWPTAWYSSPYLASREQPAASSQRPWPGSQLLVFCCQLVGLPAFCTVYPRGQDGKGLGVCGSTWQFNRMRPRGVLCAPGTSFPRGCTSGTGSWYFIPPLGRCPRGLERVFWTHGRNCSFMVVQSGRKHGAGDWRDGSSFPGDR